MIVYIAGKVSGLPLIDVTQKFGAAQKLLEAEGFEVINPLTVVSEKGDGWKTKWPEAMRLCITELMKADAIYMLPDVKDSKGALIECGIAHNLGMAITDCLDGLWHVRLNNFEIPDGNMKSQQIVCSTCKGKGEYLETHPESYGMVTCKCNAK